MWGKAIYSIFMNSLVPFQLYKWLCDVEDKAEWLKWPLKRNWRDMKFLVSSLLEKRTSNILAQHRPRWLKMISILGVVQGRCAAGKWIILSDGGGRFTSCLCNEEWWIRRPLMRIRLPPPPRASPPPARSQHPPNVNQLANYSWFKIPPERVLVPTAL